MRILKKLALALGMCVGHSDAVLIHKDCPNCGGGGGTAHTASKEVEQAVQGSPKRANVNAVRASISSGPPEELQYVDYGSGLLSAGLGLFHFTSTLMSTATRARFSTEVVDAHSAVSKKSSINTHVLEPYKSKEIAADGQPGPKNPGNIPAAGTVIVSFSANDGKENLLTPQVWPLMTCVVVGLLVFFLASFGMFKKVPEPFGWPVAVLRLIVFIVLAGFILFQWFSGAGALSAVAPDGLEKVAHIVTYRFNSINDFNTDCNLNMNGDTEVVTSFKKLITDFVPKIRNERGNVESNVYYELNGEKLEVVLYNVWENPSAEFMHAHHTDFLELQELGAYKRSPACRRLLDVGLPSSPDKGLFHHTIDHFRQVAHEFVGGITDEDRILALMTPKWYKLKF